MCFDRVMDRGFGEVFVALNKKSNEKVAIKKVKMTATDERCENENERLKTSTYPSVITATIPLR